MPYRLLPEMSSATLAAILELVNDGIWDWNANTGYVYRSPGWYRMLGYPPDELDNTVLTWESVIHPDDFESVMEQFDNYICGLTPSYKIEYRCRTNNGSYLWIEDRGHIIERNSDGSVARMVGAHRDLSTEKHLQEQIALEKLTLHDIISNQTNELIAINKELTAKVREAELLAVKDALTGLYNRLHFENTLKSEHARSARFNEPLSLLAIDIDNLKPINDQYGHTAGDQVLVSIADTLRSHIRAVDIPVRWGGDEFMVLLPNTDLAQATMLADKLRARIAALCLHPNTVTSASFGVTQLHPGESPSAFTSRADQALYQAKKAGRDQVISVA